MIWKYDVWDVCRIDNEVIYLLRIFKCDFSYSYAIIYFVKISTDTERRAVSLQQLSLLSKWIYEYRFGYR